MCDRSPCTPGASKDELSRPATGNVHDYLGGSLMSQAGFELEQKTRSFELPVRERPLPLDPGEEPIRMLYLHVHCAVKASGVANLAGQAGLSTQ